MRTVYWIVCPSEPTLRLLIARYLVCTTWLLPKPVIPCLSFLGKPVQGHLPSSICCSINVCWRGAAVIVSTSPGTRVLLTFNSLSHACILLLSFSTLFPKTDGIPSDRITPWLVYPLLPSGRRKENGCWLQTGLYSPPVYVVQGKSQFFSLHAIYHLGFCFLLTLRKYSRMVGDKVIKYL